MKRINPAVADQHAFADLVAVVAGLVRDVEILKSESVKRRLDGVGRRTRDKERAYALIWIVAKAYGAANMNTAAAVRAMVAGDLEPPPGQARNVDMIRDHYDPRIPHLRTFWNAMVDRRERDPLK